MSYYRISTLFSTNKLIGNVVTIKGWIKSIRKHNKSNISFVSVNDGSNIISLQIIVNNSMFDKQLSSLTVDSSVKITGLIQQSKGKLQTIEILAHNIIIYGLVNNPDKYPISPKKHTMEHLRKYAHLRSRTKIISAITRIRHFLKYAIHNFLYKKNFFCVDTPILTSNDCEGAGNLLKVIKASNKNEENFQTNKDFFGKEDIYLTVSGQLHLETYCTSLTKVYNLGPTFRAENSNTKRHLVEFWMLEVEQAFTDLNTITALAENLIKYVIQYVLDNAYQDIEFCQNKNNNDTIQLIKNLEIIIHKSFIKIDYNEAIKILEKNKNNFIFPISWGQDLQTEHERYLCEFYSNTPVIIINFPIKVKAFYMRKNDDNQTVSSLDIIFPKIGEIVGGGQREERINILQDQMLLHKLKEKKLKWYTDLRIFGTVPHSGFGLGIERLLSYLTNIDNVRDLIAYPRVTGNFKF